VEHTKYGRVGIFGLRGRAIQPDVRIFEDVGLMAHVGMTERVDDIQKGRRDLQRGEDFSKSTLAEFERSPRE
jgi:hypothetical protein